MSGADSGDMRFHLRLPATSANLGPAFDTAAVALNLHLKVSAAKASRFSIAASGRNADACSILEKNLILDTYKRVLQGSNQPVLPLRLEVENEIPLGMGCGSSAAARLAGIALALEFGEIEWSDDQVLAYATELEGHPDNAIACWLGGMTVAAVSADKPTGSELGGWPVTVARFKIPGTWTATLVFPESPVRTEESRKLLPDNYSRVDVVANLQHCGLLVAAFASGNGEMLRAAMRDRLHQPYRAQVCPLVGQLASLQREPGVLGVALSGAGPAALLISERKLDRGTLDGLVHRALGDSAAVEVLHCGFASGGVSRSRN